MGFWSIQLISIWRLNILRIISSDSLECASEYARFSAEMVVGIRMDTTGSSPLPVDRNKVPLGSHSEWKSNLDAQCWLWKNSRAIAKPLGQPK